MVEEIAEVASVPVINALTDDHHPCQGLADLLTIEEHLGHLEGVRVAYVGDGNNMAHTYLLGGALAGMHVSIACPEGFQPLDSVVEQARSIAAETGATISLTTDPVAGVTDADVVITDTWASMGQEDEHATRLAAFQPFQVNPSLMAHAADGALFMHCLPAHRGEEVVDEVIDAPYSVVFDEAENRLHAQKALALAPARLALAPTTDRDWDTHMRKRLERQDAIRRIVRNERVKTQRTLVDLLKAQGYVCTQATVSRDITEMGLKKLPEGVYVLAEDLHLQRMVSDLVFDVKRSEKLVLVKASSGTAPGVAAALDAAEMEGILGSVAGDDTILIITTGEAEAALLVDTLDKFRGVAPERSVHPVTAADRSRAQHGKLD